MNTWIWESSKRVITLFIYTNHERIQMCSLSHSLSLLKLVYEEAWEGGISLVERVFIYATILQLQVNTLAGVEKDEGRVGALLVVVAASVSRHLVASLLHQCQPDEGEDEGNKRKMVLLKNISFHPYISSETSKKLLKNKKRIKKRNI